MKVLIVSDTHRKNDNYLKVLQMVGPLDMVVHCGDAEGSEDVLKDETDCPLQIVLGNSDFFTDLPRELEFNIGKYKVWVTHGHHSGVYMGTGMIKSEAREKGADIVFFGHTHEPIVDMTDSDVIAVNPGSISYPRQSGYRPSYVLMEIDRFDELHFSIAYL